MISSVGLTSSSINSSSVQKLMTAMRASPLPFPPATLTISQSSERATGFFALALTSEALSAVGLGAPTQPSVDTGRFRDAVQPFATRWRLGDLFADSGTDLGRKSDSRPSCASSEGVRIRLSIVVDSSPNNALEDKIWGETLA